ncbi:hypothetical protein ABK040_006758 [Willaertia magna]
MKLKRIGFLLPCFLIILYFLYTFVSSQTITTCSSTSLTITTFQNGLNPGRSICNQDKPSCINSNVNNLIADFQIDPSFIDLNQRKIIYSKLTPDVTFNYLFTYCTSTVNSYTSSTNLTLNNNLLLYSINNFQISSSNTNCLSKSSCATNTLAKSSNNPIYPTTLPLNQGSNQLLIDNISSGPQLCLASIVLNLCTIPKNSTILDLQLIVLDSFIELSTVRSVIDNDPFGNARTTFNQLIQIQNNALDVGPSIQFTISSSLLTYIDFNITNIVKINKLNGQTDNLIIDQNYSVKYNGYSLVKVDMVNINLSKDDIIYLNTSYSINDKFTSDYNFNDIVFSVTSLEDAFEMNNNDNSATSKMVLYNRTINYIPQNIDYPISSNLLLSVSDLYIYDFIPLVINEEIPTYYLQFNLIIDSAQYNSLTKGTLNVFSSKGNQKVNIDFKNSDFVSVSQNQYVLYFTIPSSLLDCNSFSPTKLYMKFTNVATLKIINYRIKLFKKQLTIVNDITQIYNNIKQVTFTEGYGFYIKSFGSRDVTPQNIELKYPAFTSPSNNDFIVFVDNYNQMPLVWKGSNSFTSKTLATQSMMVNLVNAFPGNVLMFFTDCPPFLDFTLTFTTPEMYTNPPVLNLNNTQNYRFNGNYNGNYYFYVNIPKASNTNSIFVTAQITNTILATDNDGKLHYTPSKIVLVAYRGSLSSVNSFSKRLSFVATQSDQIVATFNCTNTRINTNDGYRQLTVTNIIPINSNNDIGIWKFALFIDGKYTDSKSYVIINTQVIEPKFTLTRGVNSPLLSTTLFSYSDTYMMITFPSFVLNEDPSSLYLSFDSSTLNLKYRLYEIYLRFGDKPTTQNYHLKSPRISFSDPNTASRFDVRFIFNTFGTTVYYNDNVNASSISSKPFVLISKERFDVSGSILYIMYHPIEGSELPNSLMCSPSLTSYVSLSYNYNYKSYSSFLLPDSLQFTLGSIYYLNQSKFEIERKYLSKSIMIEMQLESSLNIYKNIIPMLIIQTKDNVETYPMSISTMEYVYSSSPYKIVRYDINLPITERLLKNSKNSYDYEMMVIVPKYLNNTYTTTSSSIYSFDSSYRVDSPVALSGTLLNEFLFPIWITIAVVFGILLIVYVVHLFVVLTYCVLGVDIDIIGLTDNTNKNQSKFSTPLFMFTIGISMDSCCIQPEKYSALTNDQKIKRRRIAVSIWGGAIILFGLVFTITFLILTILQGSELSSLLSLDKSTVDFIPNKLIISKEVKACCSQLPQNSDDKLHYGSTSSNFQNRLREQLYCIDPYYISSGSSRPLIKKINDLPVTFSNVTKYIYGGERSLSEVLIYCPQSDITFISSTADSVNDFGIVLLVLGILSIGLGILPFIVLLYEVKGERFSFDNPFKTTGTTNNNIENRTVTTQNKEPTVTNKTDAQKREEEYMKEVDKKELGDMFHNVGNFLENEPKTQVNDTINVAPNANDTIKNDTNIKQPSIPQQQVGITVNMKEEETNVKTESESSEASQVEREEEDDVVVYNHRYYNNK